MPIAQLPGRSAPSEIGRVGDQFAVLGQDGVQRDDGGLHLGEERRLLRCFEDDLEWTRANLRRNRQDAAIALADDAVLGVEPVNERVGVAGKYLVGGGQGWFEQMFRERRAADKTVSSGAAVVRVQGDDPVEGMTVEFRLKELNLRLHGMIPELAVQIPAAARAAGVVLVTRRIAHGINEQAKPAGQLGRMFEQPYQVDQSVRALRLVPMERGE